VSLEKSYIPVCVCVCVCVFVYMIYENTNLYIDGYYTGTTM